MAFSTLSEYVESISNPYDLVCTAGSQVATAVSLKQWQSMFVNSGGTAPTAAAACSNATTGALPVRDVDSGSLWVTSVNNILCPDPLEPLSDLSGGMLMLVDRLSHQGGLASNNSLAQTTNLPTAALTRYTSGVGVMAALEVYTAVGTTSVRWTISYTNQDGTSGKTGRSGITYNTLGGASPNNQPGAFLLMALAPGDTGVKSVENVDLVSTTGTGTFGVTLFKPLLIMPARFYAPSSGNGLLSLGGQIPEVLAGACLQWVYTSDYANSSGNNKEIITMTTGKA